MIFQHLNHFLLTRIANHDEFQQIMKLVRHIGLIICCLLLRISSIFIYRFVKEQEGCQGLKARHMILNNSYTVKLTKKYAKILYLYAAYNETFVFLALITGKRQGVVHVNKEGQILFEHQFNIAMDTMGMLDEKQAIFVETRRNRISVLNLETHVFSYFPHQFINEQSDQTDIQTFSQTKYLCIEQKGRYNDNRYRLTYYPYPLRLVEVKDRKVTKTIAVYQSKQNQWTYEHMTRRANNYSVMCWYKPRHDDSFQFKTYEIVEGKGVYQNTRFSTPISVEPNIPKMETVITNVWHLYEKKYIFICLTNKTESKRIGGTVINSNFVVNIDKNDKREIRQSKFTFGPYQDYLIDYYNLGICSMFRTYMIENGKVLKTPTYFVDNQTETIIAEQIWECNSLVKYEFPGYGSNIVCENQYQTSENDYFKLTVKRIFKSKDLYMHLMCNYPIKISQELIEDVLCVLGVPGN